MTDQVDTSQLVGSGTVETVPPVVPEVPKKPRRAPAKKRRAATAKAADAHKERSKGADAAKKAEAKATAAAIVEGTAAYEAAKLNQVETYEDLPTNIEEFQLRFASRGAFVQGAIDVSPSALAPAGGGRVTYTVDVDFNAEGAPALVKEAWLIASNGEAVCCDLGVGLTVGGGHHAKVPASHLLF